MKIKRLFSLKTRLFPREHLSPPVSFTGGEYWFAWSNSNTAVTVQATAPNNTLGAIVGATNGNFGTAANAYSGGMPASLGAITNITSSINIPLIFFEVS